VLGVATDTLDLAGTVLREEPVPDDAAERLAAALPRFVGEVALVPPMVSALHHEGKRLYEIARAGETVEREARVSTIASLVTTGPSAREGERLRVSLRVVCSSGTYVRSLGEALAAELGLPGAVDRLRRTTVGRFRVEDASTLEEIAADRDAIRVLEPEVLAERLPLAELSAEDAARFLHGNPVTWSGEAEGEVRVRASGRFLGIGTVEEGRLRPTRVLADREDPADA
jgi:tRNA pseudouridine55 synthase